MIMQYDLPTLAPRSRAVQEIRFYLNMLTYLCLKKRTITGERYVVPELRSKQSRYGPVIATRQVTRKTPTLITGAHDSGKSRVLERLHSEERAIWGKKIKAPAVWLGALQPLQAWTDAKHVETWWNGRIQKLEQEAKDNGQPTDTLELRTWAKLPTYKRAESLADYLKDTGAVLFLDDCHKLAGRKLQVARACALTARVWCAAASNEQRIPPNLRSVLMRRDPQMIRLGTEVAYDATDAMTWILAVMLLVAGAWEASLVVAGLKTLASSRLAARQDA